jgi:UDP-glucose 4-epimerase
MEVEVNRVKFLVTGGAGFIGCNIVRRLIREGHEIVVLDDMSLGKEENLKGLPTNKARVVKGDVREMSLVEELAKGVAGVFHMAARSSAPMFSPDPREGIQVNLQGFFNVMDVARRKDFPVVYASTSSLYSRCKPPHREDMAVKPGSFYEYSFYAREGAAGLFAELYGLRVAGLRYFSVYGPHEEYKGRYANNISQFMWDMMGGKKPVIYGDGAQTRDFTFVEDVVEANLLAMKSGLKGEVINVGTGIATSFNEIVGLLNRELGTAIKPKYVPNPIKNYVKHTQADTTRAQRLLNFRAEVPLKEGVRRAIEYYRGLKWRGIAP